MRHGQNIRSGFKRFLSVVVQVFLLFALSQKVSGQEPPPRPITVTWTNQNLSFGAFYQGGIGGTVTISPVGSRSSTGDIVLLNLGYPTSPAPFRVVGNPGTVISILTGGPGFTLTGVPAGTMTLNIGNTDPVMPYVLITVPPNYTEFKIGGTLVVGNPLTNPPGDYTGTFEITFIQE